MSIDANLARFLLEGQAEGVSFRRTATIGRLGFDLRPRFLQNLLPAFKIVPQPDTMQRLTEACNGYAEPFLSFLGAEQIVSVDASSYEGASLVHDMNEPVPSHLKNRFDAVVDGGSLEHIFNFPVAIRNCMEMVSVGGHFVTATPANNYPGHGFYQFSAELFFRVFSAENGYSVERAIICERDSGRWFQAVDPARLQRRGFFTNCASTLLLVQARRLREAPIFAKRPQQSDYEMLWQRSQDGPPSSQTPSSARQFVGRAMRRIDSVLPRFKTLTDLIRDHGGAESRLGSPLFPRIPKT